MVKEKTFFAGKSTCSTLSPSHVRTVYNTRKGIVAVNSIFNQAVPYSEVLLNIMLRHRKERSGLEFYRRSRYNEAQQNVAGASLCDLRRTS